MKAILATLTLLVSACGQMQQPASATMGTTSDQAAPGPDKGTPTATGTASDQDVETSPPVGTPTTGSTVTAEAKCSVTTGAPVSAPKSKWVLAPGRWTLAEALAQAPKGARLPTRGELIDALDAGLDVSGLASFSDRLWTASPVAFNAAGEYAVQASGLSVVISQGTTAAVAYVMGGK